MSTYEIFALNYAGNVTGSGAFVRWLSDWDKESHRTYFYWLVRTRDVNVLVDCGCRPDQAETAELPGYSPPWEMLGRLGLAPDDIGHVMLTHLHWDHAGALEFFPEAHIWVHHAEYRFWLEDPIARKPPFELVSDRRCLERLAELKGSDRLTLVEEDRELLPGIRGLFAPGHTPGLMAVGVTTARGQAVLGSDCGHLFA
ncbi:MAG: N-acyl homoserine lactonase family protein, partial [Deltaproteobacteria bacterium]